MIIIRKSVKKPVLEASPMQSVAAQETAVAPSTVAEVVTPAAPQPAQPAGKTPSLGRPPNLKKAKAHVTKMLKQIRAAHRSGKEKDARHLGRLYLASHDAHLVAVHAANRAIKPHKRVHHSLLPGYAAALNPWAGIDEKVIIHPKPKPGPNLEYRPILEFGFENAALQHLLLPLLRAQADLHPNQYAMRGTHRAIERVAKLLEAGNVWATEIDIRNCYQSFDGERVADLLPVPKEVARNVLTGASLSLCLNPSFVGPADPGEDDEIIFPELFAAVRQGISQGAATSPLVAEMMLASVFKVLPDCGAVTAYADNFLVMGKTESEVLSISEALRSAIKAHPAGPLWPKEPRIFGSGMVVEFLAHQLWMSEGSVVIAPGTAKREELHRRMEDGLRKIKKAPAGAEREKMADQLRRYVRGWAANFKLCNCVEEIKNGALAQIDKLT